jgi:hypothetical protein
VAKQKNDRSSHKYSNTSASIYCKDFFNPSNRAILKIEKESDFALGIALGYIQAEIFIKFKNLHGGRYLLTMK